MLITNNFSIQERTGCFQKKAKLILCYDILNIKKDYPKIELLLIPQSKIDTNENLVQNPGY